VFGKDREMTLALDRPPRTATLPALAGADVRVPLVTGERVAYANLDLAASAPALAAVADHVAEVLPLLSSVHRGAGYLSQVSTALLERARECVGEFVGARGNDVTVLRHRPSRRRWSGWRRPCARRRRPC
jgi:hypothetical protein